MSAILGLIDSLSSVIRWGEPWDLESDDDPLLDRDPAEDTTLWG